MFKPSIAAKSCEMASIGGTEKIEQNTAIIDPYLSFAPAKGEELISQVQKVSTRSTSKACLSNVGVN